MKQLYKYSEKLYEVREISESAQKENFDIKIIKNLDREHMVNIKTGEVIEKEKSEHLTQKAVEKSMLKVFRVLLNEIAPLVNKGEIYFLTLTTRNEIDYYEFNKLLDNYVETLKYEAQKNNKDFKYAFVKESTKPFQFHAHGLIWCDKQGDMPFSKEFIKSKWKHCEEFCKDVQNVNSEQDLIKVLFYLFNYSTKNKNQKVVTKSNGLKNFPTNARLIKMSKGLQEAQGKAFDNSIINNNHMISQATRKLPDGRDFASTFYFQS